MYTKYVFITIFSFFTNVILIPLYIHFAKKYNLVTNPSNDRWNQNKIVTMGGGVVFFVFISILLFFKLNIFILLSFTLIFFVGLIDDIYILKPKLKLIFTSIPILLIISYYIYNNYFDNFYIYILIFIWFIIIINSINLIDNIDGLMSGISSIILITFSFIFFLYKKNDQIIVSLTLLGALLGFLIYNFNKAKIFIGDSGALFVGFVLSFLAIEIFKLSTNKIFIIIPFLILSIPLFDTFFVIIKRFLFGNSILKGGKDHLSHRLINMGFTAKVSVIIFSPCS